MIWGRQDPHIPLEGRTKVMARLNEVGAKFSWHEVNGAGTLSCAMRDRAYDPELARQLYGEALQFFHRRLSAGDMPAQAAGSGETRH